MKYDEFLQQDKYCQKQNTPEGNGCDECPAKNKELCADAMRKAAGDLCKSQIGSHEFWDAVNHLKDFGLSEFSILAIYDGTLEFLD